ncbi:hypothetical protein MBLNU457_g0300t1 [Dothideomycetes sp. NU457]
MPQSVLITGCSLGGLGDALAQEFHKQGVHVIASARNLSKMDHLVKLGIDVVQLDTVDDNSIKAAVDKVRELTGGQLEILVNNAGAVYNSPILDINFTEAKAMFDLNFWSYIAVTQAFIPLLRQAKDAKVVMQTSIASVAPMPWFGIYAASKAAMASVTDTLRLELQPFNIKVVELKTGCVKSMVFKNQNVGAKPRLPEDSIYAPAKEIIEDSMLGKTIEDRSITAESWARHVVSGILKSNPSYRLWKGTESTIAWASAFLPASVLISIVSKIGKLDQVAEIMRLSS